MNWRKYLQQLRAEDLDERTRQRLRALFVGKDPQHLDAKTQRELRAILKAFMGRQAWLQGKVVCDACGGEGIETVENTDDAPIVKNGKGYRMERCQPCGGAGHISHRVHSGSVH